MQQGSRLPQLDTILQSLNTIQSSSQQTPKLWNPSLQTSFASQHTGQHFVVGSPQMGASMVTKPPTQDLFLKNYINKNDATKNMYTSMQIAANTYKAVDTKQGSPSPNVKTCQVYPPLLVRTNTEDFIPVELFMDGEIRRTNGYPDMIVNFHADTGAITLTVCQIDPKKMKQYEIAMQVLYSLTSDQPVTIPQFTDMYDNKRYTLLRSLANKK